MAIDRNLWFVDTKVKMYTDVIALNLGDAGAGVFKLALFQDSVVPDASQVDPAYGAAPWNAGEVAGAGYTAGGLALTGVTFTEHPSSAGWMRWKFDNVSWAASTIPDAKGALIYAPGLANRAILLRAFPQIYSSQDGTFTINFHSTDGAAKINLVGAVL